MQSPWLHAVAAAAAQGGGGGGAGGGAGAATAASAALEGALRTLRAATRIVVLVGAGASVACGLPDFRSPGGLYDAIARSDHPALASISDPQEVFDLDVFRSEPEVFYAVARLLYRFDDDDDGCGGGGGGAAPSLAHRLLGALSRAGKLQRVYSQNVDGLEAAGGVAPGELVACHGSLARVTCLRCGRSAPAAATPGFVAAVRAGAVARCAQPRCAGGRGRRAGGGLLKPPADDDGPPPGGDGGCGGLLKPDAVFFREPLPGAFAAALPGDLAAADLLLVLGSSLRVQPVAGIPAALRRSRPAVPALLVNAEPLGGGRGGGGGGGGFDAELLGSCDVVCEHLWRSLALPGLDAALAACGLTGGASGGGGGGGDIVVSCDDEAPTAGTRVRFACARHDALAAACHARMQQRSAMLLGGGAGGGARAAPPAGMPPGKRPRRTYA